MPGAEVLRVDCVGHSFGARRVLTSATLRAVAGEVTVLFGRNGAGKSTLLRIAAGELAPDTGMVFDNGAARLHRAAAQLGRDGLFWLPDRDLLSASVPLRQQLQWFAGRFGRAAIDDGVQACRLQPLLDRTPREFSEGEKRRAEVAVAIVRRPVCLLADEPLRGMSPTDAELLCDALRQLAGIGTAVVVTGHETTHLMDVATRVSLCVAGTTYELGDPTAARANELFVREYLRTAR